MTRDLLHSSAFVITLVLVAAGLGNLLPAAFSHYLYMAF